MSRSARRASFTSLDDAAARGDGWVILDLIDRKKNTPPELETDGKTLIIRPMQQPSRAEQVVAAADEIMDAHAETFRKLAK